MGEGNLGREWKGLPIRKLGQDDPGHHRIVQIVRLYRPLTGLLLNTNQVVVGETVGVGMVLGFDGRFTVTHHEVKKRDSTAQGREGHE